MVKQAKLIWQPGMGLSNHTDDNDIKVTKNERPMSHNTKLEGLAIIYY